MVDTRIISQNLKERIEVLAYEKWEARMETGQYVIFEKGELREITAEDDYLEAEDEIIRGEKKKWC